jgi:hypothetical protein
MARNRNSYLEREAAPKHVLRKWTRVTNDHRAATPALVLAGRTSSEMPYCSPELGQIQVARRIDIPRLKSAALVKSPLRPFGWGLIAWVTAMAAVQSIMLASRALPGAW